MEIQKTLDEAIEKLTSLRVELMKLDKDWLEDEASKIDILLCKAHDQCALLDVVGQSEQLPCEHEFAHKPLGGNVYCWKCCTMMPK